MVLVIFKLSRITVFFELSVRHHCIVFWTFLFHICGTCFCFKTFQEIVSSDDVCVCLLKPTIWWIDSRLIDFLWIGCEREILLLLWIFFPKKENDCDDLKNVGAIVPRLYALSRVSKSRWSTQIPIARAEYLIRKFSGWLEIKNTRISTLKNGYFDTRILTNVYMGK